MKAYVYKITRSDDQQYIGITVRLNKRMSDHSRSERFRNGIKKIEILKECETYQEACVLEKEFIEKYDTFYNGLNNSIDGKGNHLCSSFTTLGIKFSKETKDKMKNNHWSKNGYSNGMKNKNHSDETKSKLSEKRKGICWGPRKISLEDTKMILAQYESDNLIFNKEFVSKFIKKSQIEDFLKGNIRFEELKTPNGRTLSKETLYAEWFSEMYKTTSSAIRRIISGKSKLAEDHNG